MKVWDKALAREVEVDPGDAKVGVAQGLYVPREETHYIVDESGMVGESAPAALPGWFEKGYGFASDEDIQRYKARGSPVSAFALGAADMASFGTLNAATQGLESVGLLPDGTTQSAVYLREENPTAHISGQVGLAALQLPAAAIKGVGAAAMAARAATAAPRAMTMAGRATAQRLGMDGLGAGLGAQAARLAVEGGVEGALHGFAQGLTGADFGDPTQAAEEILAGIGVGALAGGVAGGAMAPLGAAFKAGRNKVNKGLESLFQNSTGTPANKGLGKKLEGYLRREQKRWNPGKEDLINDMSARRELLGDADLVDRTASKMAKQIDDTEIVFDDVVASGLAKAKLKNIQRLIKTDNPAEAVGWAQRAINDLEELAATIPGAKGKQLRRIADDARFSSHGGDPYKSFAAVDHAKREVDNLIGWKNIKKRQAAGMQGMNPAAEEIETVLIQANKSLRSGLEETRLWGDKAAGLQRQTNAALSSLREQGTDWRKHFMARTKGGAKYVSDPTKLKSFLGDIDGARNDLRGGVLSDRIQQQKDIAGFLRQSYDLDPSLAAKITKLEGATKGLETSFKTASGEISLVNQAKAMAQGAHTGPIAQIAGDRLAQTVGGLAAGGIGGMIMTRVVGEGLSAIANPARYYLNAGKAMQLKNSVNSHIGARIKDFFTAAVKISPTGIAVRKGAPLVQRAKTPLLVALSTGDSSSRNAAYQEAAQTLQLVAQNPDITNQRVMDSMGPMQNVAPELASSMAQRMVQNAQWVLDHTEQPNDWPTMFGEPPQLSDVELQRFKQIVAISEDPLHALDLLADDKLTITDAQAFKGMWPKLYQQTQDKILDTLSDPELREQVPYSKRIQLGIVFEMPTDPSLMPTQIALAQQADEQILNPMGGEDEGGGGGGGKFSAKAKESLEKEGTTMDQSALREA